VIEAEVDAEIRGAVERAEARMQVNLLDVFEHVHGEPTAELLAQRAELERELAASGDGAQR
jgi:phage baseplate assembly protein W